MAKPKVNLNGPSKKSGTSSSSHNNNNSNNASAGGTATTTTTTPFGSGLGTSSFFNSSPFGSSNQGTNATSTSTTAQGKGATGSATTTGSGTSTGGSSSKPIKPPKELIVRPASSSISHPNFYKTLLNINIHGDTLKAYGIAPGDLIIISKPDNPGVVAIAESSTINSINIITKVTPSNSNNNAKEQIKMTRTSRSLLGLLLGDRVSIKPISQRPEYALHLRILSLTRNPEPLRSKIVAVLHDIGVIMNGLTFTIKEYINIDKKKESLGKKDDDNDKNDDKNENDDHKTAIYHKFVIIDCGALPDLGNLSLNSNDKLKPPQNQKKRKSQKNIPIEDNGEEKEKETEEDDYDYYEYEYGEWDEDIEGQNDEIDTDLITPAYLFDPTKCTNIELIGSQNENDRSYVREAHRGIGPGGFSSIGGLDTQITRLRKAIAQPLHQADIFAKFSGSALASPEHGFLLHGPPGTGKTLLLRAIAKEMNAHVLTINGPSIVSKYLGETEAALRQMFTEARKYQPAIIFIDEIDALVPRRGSDDAGESESRVVSTLLTLLDGLNMGNGARHGYHSNSNNNNHKNSGNNVNSNHYNKVVVIGATNRLGSIDPALRRAGRFGTEIEIGIPDASKRLEILELCLKGLPHNLSKESIRELSATKMHGFVGADIAALVGHCVSLAIERGLGNNSTNVDNNDDDNDDEEDDDKNMQITEVDIDCALRTIRPSAMREILLETPRVFWTDIGGQEDVKQRLRETVDWPLTHGDTFQRLGVQQPKGILLYGPPGCSKTLTAKALATEARLNFLAVKGPEIFNKYVGESERAVREIFRKARAAAPSIIFFDEIDALSSSREDGGGGGGGGSNDKVLTSLLNEMDGIEALVGVIVLAATNRPDMIDSALMRPGRLDRLIYVGPPDYEARKKILEIQFSKMAVYGISSSDSVNNNDDDDDIVDIEYLAKETDGCSGAEIVQFCQEAGLLAMNENLDIKYICRRHFKEALGGIKRGITQEMIEYYETYNQQGRR